MNKEQRTKLINGWVGVSDAIGELVDAMTGMSSHEDMVRMLEVMDSVDEMMDAIHKAKKKTRDMLFSEKKETK